MRFLGIFLMTLGAVVALYALLIFDPTVSSGTGYGRVNNIGLLQDKQNLLIAGGIVAIIGVLLFAFSRPSASATLPVFEPQGVDFDTALQLDDATRMRQLLKTGRVNVNGDLRTGRGFLHYAVARGS